jgi:hypothetical protein
VRLTDIPLLLEARQHVTERRRGDAETALGQPERRDWFALFYIGRHDDPKNPSIPFGQCRMEHHTVLALDVGDC